MPIGTVFHLFIHLPTSAFPLPAKGKVVRIEKIRPYGRYDVGMILSEISEQDRCKLIKYLVSTVFTKADCESLFGPEKELKHPIFEEDAIKGAEVSP